MDQNRRTFTMQVVGLAAAAAGIVTVEAADIAMKYECLSMAGTLMPTQSSAVVPAGSGVE